MTYADFLARKTATVEQVGPLIDISSMHPSLHPWQKQLVAWAVRTGRAAIWADTGLGKTRMQIEWARLIGGNSLIVAPLAVCQQTVREGATIGVPVRYLRDDDELPGIRITNYEMVEHFDPATLDSVVLDESSILKQSDGKTRARLIAHFADVKYKMAATATPAPNDPEELTNQAEFLNVSTRVNMLATYFVHDQDGWRLKGHARQPMFRWMASWAVAIRRPSDLGYPDGDYLLPPLNIVPHILSIDIAPEGQLFATDIGGVGGRAKTRRATLDARCERAARLVADEPAEPWLMWCGLNDEAAALEKLIPGSVNVQGNWTPEAKAEALLAFADGQITRLITKPSIAAFGLNWQHCARMAFVGLSDSYESYYQAIRRCYRYGQHRPVDAHIILSSLESQIAANVARKEQQARQMGDELVREMRAAAEWSVA